VCRLTGRRPGEPRRCGRCHGLVHDGSLCHYGGQGLDYDAADVLAPVGSEVGVQFRNVFAAQESLACICSFLKSSAIKADMKR
jgi:hypothetical protein